MSQRNIIYHYCGSKTFLEIVRNKQIWITEAAKMNDSKEFYWLLDNLRNEVKGTPHLSKNKLMCKFLEICDAFFSGQRVFLCCFSQKPDVLSQWRSYAEEGTGFALGINKMKIGKGWLPPYGHHDEDMNIVGFKKVVYEERKQRNVIISVINTVRTTNMEIADQYRRFFDLALDMMQYSFYCKNPSFKEESEIRYICRITSSAMCNKNNNHPQLHFRTTIHGISPYLQMDLTEDSIEEVWIGPKNRSLKEDIFALLNQTGFKVQLDDVMKSKSTLR